MEATEPFFKLPPYDHQREVWEKTRDLEGFALFWEMGVGKSCEIVGTTSWLYRKGEINTLIVVAPNGVKTNWTRDEVPDHLPDAIMAETEMMCWFSEKAGNKATQERFAEVLAHPGLVVFVMAYDAVMTEKGSKALKALLTKRDCLYVLDESGRIKTPGSKRTKRISASARYGKYRRILTGTPVDNSPFDVYTQIRFICPGIWQQYGVPNFGAFKTRYGIWEKRYNRTTKREFPHLTRYIKLDELHSICDTVGSRLLKSDVLDLPDKLYTKSYFELDGPQKKAYKELDKKFRTWLGDNGKATADLILTRMLRLTQICSGFIKNDDEEVVPVGKNVRLKALLDLLEDVSGSTIIWCRWSHSVDEIRKVLGEKDAVYFDGRTSADEREDAIQRFQKQGTARYFVAKASAAGEGLTLHRAKTCIYFENSWSLRERLQSEDRAHRAGMSDEPVTYIDLIAAGTYDEKLLQALRAKRDTAAIVTGDSFTPWA